MDGLTGHTIKGYKSDAMFNFTWPAKGHARIIRRIRRILISVGLEDRVGARKSFLAAVLRVKVYWHKYERVVVRTKKFISKINQRKIKSLDYGKVKIKINKHYSVILCEIGGEPKNGNKNEHQTLKK